VRLAFAISTALALTIAGCGGSGSTGGQPHSGAASSSAGGGGPASAARRLLGLPALPPRSPLPGYLLIADRDNNRLIVVSPSKRIVWRFPSTGDLRPGQAFAGPDDAFLTPSGHGIITNEEFSDALALIRLGRRPRIAFQYGRNDVPGSGPGYLSHPDDAYQLPNGLISVADIINCRVLFIRPGHGIARSIGQAGDCVHNPPTSLSQPNGDTPLPDGGVLVTEIGGWVDRFDRHGRLRWTIRTPTNYPSDAQLLPNGDVLVAGFDDPGHIYVLTQRGKVIWSYGPATGGGALNKPSLALPLSGRLIGATDDYGQRIVVIDRLTKKIVWQYGHLDQPGSAPGYLNKPDGLDLIR
jgi:hypothetical protein